MLRKPMQLMEHWGNMAKFALHKDKSSGCVLNSLQIVNMALRQHHIIDYNSSLFGY